MTRPLRVAHVVATAGATGVESHLWALLAGFDRREIDPVLFTPGPGILVDRVRDAGVPVEFAAPARKLAFGEAGTLRRRLAGSFDVVHAHGPRAAFWAVRAARAARVPRIVTTVHEMRWRTLRPSLQREVWVALEGRDLLRADLLITPSEAARRELIGRWPSLAPRTRVVHASAPLLLDPGSIPTARARSEAGAPLRLVTIGRLEWTKGHDRLLDALGRLRDAGVAITIDIAGAGPEAARLRRASERLGVARFVRWHEAHADVPALLAGADLFVTATRSEMFGIAVLEAMAVGLPVVAPAVGSLPELVAHETTGLLVDPDPAEDLGRRLAAAIASLAADPSRRERLGRAGAAVAAERFSPRAFAAGVARVYREGEGPISP